MAERPVLLLFARSPVPGRVKTRLMDAGAGALSPQQACDLYRAFLEDASRLYGRGTAWDSVLCADPGPGGSRSLHTLSAPVAPAGAGRR